MPTEPQLRKQGYPRKCHMKRCRGYGLYYIKPTVRVEPFAMSRDGAEQGYRTIPCPSCGANANPNGSV